MIVQLIPYESFKERIKIVKSLYGKGHIEIWEDYIYFVGKKLDFRL